MKLFLLSLMTITLLFTACSKGDEAAKTEDSQKPNQEILNAYSKFAGTWKMTYLKCNEACGPVDLPRSRDWQLTLGKNGEYTFKDAGQVTDSRNYELKIDKGSFIMDGKQDIRIDESGLLVISSIENSFAGAVKKFQRLK